MSKQTGMSSYKSQLVRAYMKTRRKDKEETLSELAKGVKRCLFLAYPDNGGELPG